MVSPTRWVAPVAIGALVLASAFGLAIQQPDTGVTYVPREEPTEPLDATVKPDLPPTVLRFSGQITFSDPSRAAMGPDPMLWSESCHLLDLKGGTFTTVDVALTEGASDGAAEDLDVYAFDADDERLAEAADASSGIGPHHTLALPDGTHHLLVCLAGGARAGYDAVAS